MSRYVLGSEKVFYDFVDSISKNDQIGIVTHTDLDGIASGVFLQKILESKDLKINFIEFLNYSSDALKKVIEKKCDVLFFTDWNADNYPIDLEEIRKKSKVLVFDHHPLNNELKDKSNIIKTNYDYCSSHALFDLASNGRYLDTKDLEWLACSAIIIDYTWDKDPNNFNFIKSIYPQVKKDNSIWNSQPAEIGKAITNSLIYYTPDYKKVYDLVLKGDLTSLNKADKIIRKEIEMWIKKFEGEAEYFQEKKVYFAYGTPKYNIVSAVASMLSDGEFKDNNVVIASDIKEKKGFVKLSARNNSGKVDLGKILKECCKDFKNAYGGGHVRAASATIMKEDLNDFKECILLKI